MLAKPSLKGYRSYWVELDESCREHLEDVNSISSFLPNIYIKDAIAHIRKRMIKSELWYIGCFSKGLGVMIKFPIILSPNEASEIFLLSFANEKKLIINRIGELTSNYYCEIFDDFAYEKYIDFNFNHIKFNKTTNFKEIYKYDNKVS